MKKIISLFLCAVMLCALFLPAFAEESGDWTYTVTENGEAEISGYTGSALEVTIPAELDGHPVTGIGSIAFYENALLTAVTIPGSVKTIGESAFSFCPALSRVTIGDGVETIGMYAFTQCPALSGITVPDSVDTIGEMALGYYTPDGANVLPLPGFTITGGDGSAAERYADANGFAFLVSGEEPAEEPTACAHGTLICKECAAERTREELLTEWGYGLGTGSVLSEGNLTIIVGIAAAAVFGLGGFILGRKKAKSEE